MKGDYTQTPGTISITRLSNKDDPVLLTLRDGRIKMVEIRCSLEAFSDALLGLTNQPCAYRSRILGAPETNAVDPGDALFVVATMCRDAVNRFRDSGLQSDADELDRLTGLLNLPKAAMVEACLREVESARLPRCPP